MQAVPCITSAAEYCLVREAEHRCIRTLADIADVHCKLVVIELQRQMIQVPTRASCSFADCQFLQPHILTQDDVSCFPIAQTRNIKAHTKKYH